MDPIEKIEDVGPEKITTFESGSKRIVNFEPNEITDIDSLGTVSKGDAVIPTFGQAIKINKK